MDIAPRVAQLLVSRVCHDLVGGISAVNAGVELANDSHGAMDAETLDLINQSARQVGHRLSFFRAAFGLGGVGSEGIALADLSKLASDYVGQGRINLVWQDSEIEMLRPGPAKIALNLILLAMDALPRGGTVSISVMPLSGGVGLALSCAGSNAGLNTETAAALDTETDPDDLSAHTVAAYFCAVLARTLKGELEYACPEAGLATLACVCSG